jgi:SAM-dependent methyltransferase
MMDKNSQDDFDFNAVFEVDDYLYFYSEVLTDQRTEAEVSALVSLLQLDSPRKILDLACGFGRLLLFTAFGYFSDEANLQVLINARNALVPGGRLVFDVSNRDNFLKTMHPFFVMEKEGNLMIDRMSFDALEGRSIDKRIVIRDGVRKDKPFSIRLYNPNEIHALLTQAGLVLEHLYADWAGSELTIESRRMVVIARKP